MPSVISGDANVSASEFGFLDGVTSGLQSQIDSKLNLAGGKILQTVQTLTNSIVSTTSTSWVASGLVGTITPSSSNSRILVLTNQVLWQNNVSVASVSTVFRGAVGTGTNIATAATSSMSDTLASNMSSSATAATVSTASMLLLDSPSTTSAVTYRSAFLVTNSAATFIAQVNGWTGVMILMEVSA